MQKVGHEYGTTTGRPRRCGWLDLNVVKYGNKINGYTSVNITKFDVLSGLDTLKVATHYELDGKKLDGSMPATLSELERCKVVYETLPGFKEDISQITEYSKLPSAAKQYLEFIEHHMGVPISWIGTGPGREQMIINQ